MRKLGILIIALGLFRLTVPVLAHHGFDTEYDATLRAILARNPNREHFGESVAFSTVSVSSPDGLAAGYHSGDRTSFLGEMGRLEAPAALVRGERLQDRRPHAA